ncbi:MAG: tyrosine-type recombinase/integrase [Terrimicrobiaceae bacterium]
MDSTIFDTPDDGMREVRFSVRPHNQPTGKGPFQQVKVGQVVIPIYRSEAQGFPRFFVVYYEKGFRIRRSFTDFEEAKREARLAGERVVAGRTQAPRMAPHECDVHLTSKKILEKFGLSMLPVVQEYTQCHELLGGGSLLGAIKDYVERNKGVRTGVTVADAAKEFLKAKEADGMSTRYMAQLRSDVNRFAAAFPCPILHIKSHQIDEWLRKLGGAPRTRNSTHTSICTFFSWAKSSSYLPKNEETEAEALSKVKTGDTETEIFTPEQMKTILDAATPEMIPFIVLGAFAGMRAAEIVRIDWSAIDFKRKIIMIRAGQAKTASRRIIPISDNLSAWLQPHVDEGLVVPSAEVYRKVTDHARKLKIEWPHNVLRHSYISYRIAKIKNAQEVALEAGNSPTIIFKHYRELATEDQADAWFGINSTSSNKPAPKLDVAKIKKGIRKRRLAKRMR